MANRIRRKRIAAGGSSGGNMKKKILFAIAAASTASSSSSSCGRCLAEEIASSNIASGNHNGVAVAQQQQQQQQQQQHNYFNSDSSPLRSRPENNGSGNLPNVASGRVGGKVRKRGRRDLRRRHPNALRDDESRHHHHSSDERYRPGNPQQQQLENQKEEAAVHRKLPAGHNVATAAGRRRNEQEEESSDDNASASTSTSSSDDNDDGDTNNNNENNENDIGDAAMVIGIDHEAHPPAMAAAKRKRGGKASSKSSKSSGSKSGSSQDAIMDDDDDAFDWDEEPPGDEGEATGGNSWSGSNDNDDGRSVDRSSNDSPSGSSSGKSGKTSSSSSSSKDSSTTGSWGNGSGKSSNDSLASGKALKSVPHAEDTARSNDGHHYSGSDDDESEGEIMSESGDDASAPKPPHAGDTTGNSSDNNDSFHHTHETGWSNDGHDKDTYHIFKPKSSKSKSGKTKSSKTSSSSSSSSSSSWHGLWQSGKPTPSEPGTKPPTSKPRTKAPTSKPRTKAPTSKPETEPPSTSSPTSNPVATSLPPVTARPTKKPPTPSPTITPTTTTEPTPAETPGKPPPLTWLGVNGCTPQSPCPVCHGDCDSNSDCSNEYECFNRDDDADVPGCEGGGSGDVAGADYCYDPGDNGGMGTESPAASPEKGPTGMPQEGSSDPTNAPAEIPTETPTAAPMTSGPTLAPARESTDVPTKTPTPQPSAAPSDDPVTPIPTSPNPTPTPTASDPPTTSLPALTWAGVNGCTPASPCEACFGDCDLDSDCFDRSASDEEIELACYKRADGEADQVPGCAAGGAGDVPGADYCYDVGSARTGIPSAGPSAGPMASTTEPTEEPSASPEEAAPTEEPSRPEFLTLSPTRSPMEEDTLSPTRKEVETTSPTQSPSAYKPREAYFIRSQAKSKQPDNSQSVPGPRNLQQEDTVVDWCVSGALSPDYYQLLLEACTPDSLTRTTSSFNNEQDNDSAILTGTAFSNGNAIVARMTQMDQLWSMDDMGYVHSTFDYERCMMVPSTSIPDNIGDDGDDNGNGSLDGIEAPVEIGPCDADNALNRFYYDESGMEPDTLKLQDYSNLCVTYLGGATPNKGAPMIVAPCRTDELKYGWDFVLESELGNAPTAAPTADLPRLRYAGRDACTADDPCIRKCVGDCDTNDDCFGENLECFQRERDDSTQVPGCAVGGPGDIPGADYCYDPRDANVGSVMPTSSPVAFAGPPTPSPTMTPPPLKWLGAEGCTVSAPCEACRGDCDEDDDCKGEFECFKRLVGESTAVPGCAAGGIGDVPGGDYCYDPDWNVGPGGEVTPSPTVDRPVPAAPAPSLSPIAKPVLKTTNAPSTRDLGKEDGPSPSEPPMPTRPQRPPPGDRPQRPTPATLERQSVVPESNGSNAKPTPVFENEQSATSEPVDSEAVIMLHSVPEMSQEEPTSSTSSNEATTKPVSLALDLPTSPPTQSSSTMPTLSPTGVYGGEGNTSTKSTTASPSLAIQGGKTPVLSSANADGQNSEVPTAGAAGSKTSLRSTEDGQTLIASSSPMISPAIADESSSAHAASSSSSGTAATNRGSKSSKGNRSKNSTASPSVASGRNQDSSKSDKYQQQQQQQQQQQTDSSEETGGEGNGFENTDEVTVTAIGRARTHTVRGNGTTRWQRLHDDKVREEEERVRKHASSRWDREQSEMGERQT